MAPARPVLIALAALALPAPLASHAAVPQQARTGCFVLQGPEDGPDLPERIQVVLHDPHGGTGDFERHRTVVAGGFVVDEERLHVVFVHAGVTVTLILESVGDLLAGRLLRFGEREPPAPDAWPVRAVPEPCERAP